VATDVSTDAATEDFVMDASPACDLAGRWCMRVGSRGWQPVDLVANGEGVSGLYSPFGMLGAPRRVSTSIRFNLCCKSSITAEVSPTCDRMIGTYRCHTCSDSVFEAVREGTLDGAQNRVTCSDGGV